MQIHRSDIEDKLDRRLSRRKLMTTDTGDEISHENFGKLPSQREAECWSYEEVFSKYLNYY